MIETYLFLKNVITTNTQSIQQYIVYKCIYMSFLKLYFSMQNLIQNLILRKKGYFRIADFSFLVKGAV